MFSDQTCSPLVAVVDEPPPSVAVIEPPNTDSLFLEKVTQEILDKMMEDFKLSNSQLELYEDMVKNLERNMEGLKQATNEDLDDVFNQIYDNGVDQGQSIPEICYAHVFAKMFMKHGALEKVPKTARDHMMSFLSKTPALGPSTSTENCPTPNFRVVPAPRPQVQKSSSSGASRSGPEANTTTFMSSDQTPRSVEVSSGMATFIFYLLFFCN